MKKPRSDSKLDALDMDQQRQLCEWLLTPGLNYERVKELVFEKFNVSTSGAALSKFYQSYVGSYVLERRRQAVGLATEIGEELKRAPGQFSAQTIDALEQKAFELAQNPMVDPREVKAIFSLVLKARDQELQKKQFNLDREKFMVGVSELILKAARDPKTRELAESNISNREKIAAMRKKYLAEVDALQASGEIKLPT